jgi:hypothetical protein
MGRNKSTTNTKFFTDLDDAKVSKKTKKGHFKRCWKKIDEDD